MHEKYVYSIPLELNHRCRFHISKLHIQIIKIIFIVYLMKVEDLLMKMKLLENNIINQLWKAFLGVSKTWVIKE